MTDETPVACRLTGRELAARRAGLIAEVRAAIVERRPRADGLALRFAAGRPSVELLGALIEAERQCCPFLTFTLKVAAGQGPIWLDLTGPPGTRELVEGLLEPDPPDGGA